MITPEVGIPLLVFSIVAAGTYAVLALCDPYWMRVRSRVSQLDELGGADGRPISELSGRLPVAQARIVGEFQRLNPYQAAERSRIQQRLAKAGIYNPSAVTRFVAAKMLLTLTSGGSHGRRSHRLFAHAHGDCRRASPPPCGEGLGVGSKWYKTARPPLPNPPPQGGRGTDRPCGNHRAYHPALRSITIHPAPSMRASKLAVTNVDVSSSAMIAGPAHAHARLPCARGDNRHLDVPPARPSKNARLPSGAGARFSVAGASDRRCAWVEISTDQLSTSIAAPGIGRLEQRRIFALEVSRSAGGIGRRQIARSAAGP